jgi:peptidoglycan hydrolase-like protein with peptidoglycan-binding domain
VRRALIGGAVLTTAVVAGAVAWTMRGPASPATAATTAEPVATAPVERRTLAEVADLDGTMAFADPQPLQPGSQGTVTWLPAEASVLRRGSIAARIDDRPVITLYGQLPVFRQLRNGDKGRDVKQLERNLHALGYDAGDELTVDTVFTAATARAVKRLEEAYGLSKDGVVDLDEVVYLSGARRVGGHEIEVGAHAGGKLYDTTARTRVVRIELDARKRSLVRRGKEVEVELPDGRLLKGRISTVGRVVRSEDDGAGGTKSVLDVEVAVTGNPGATDGSPVRVHVVSTAVENAIAVPVHALLALAGGGYGVELASTKQVVPVKLGASADGFVEVQAAGLAEGALVVVAQ